MSRVQLILACLALRIPVMLNVSIGYTLFNEVRKDTFFYYKDVEGKRKRYVISTDELVRAAFLISPDQLLRMVIEYKAMTEFNRKMKNVGPFLTKLQLKEMLGEEGYERLLDYKQKIA